MIFFSITTIFLREMYGSSLYNFKLTKIRLKGL